MVEQDLHAPEATAARAGPLAREPRLAACTRTLETGCAEELARQMNRAGASDLRPRLAVAALFGALDAAWSAWRQDGSAALHGLVDQAHDLLDRGLARL